MRSEGEHIQERAAAFYDIFFILHIVCSTGSGENIFHQIATTMTEGAVAAHISRQ